MEEEELNRKIEAAVVEILRESDMSSTSESMVRSMASKRLGLDLSSGVRKLFVRGIVESFLDSQQTEDEEAVGDFPAIRLKGEEEESAEQPAADREEEAEGVCSTARSRRRPNEYDDEGDLSLCRVSVLHLLMLPNKRRVTLQDFKGKTLVSIREYYLKDGEELPSSKGISLTIEQRQAFQNAVPNITAAIKKLGRPKSYIYDDFILRRFTLLILFVKSFSWRFWIMLQPDYEHVLHEMTTVAREDFTDWERWANAYLPLKWVALSQGRRFPHGTDSLFLR
ncbi:hypothetical protein ZIOFF_008958 [Zingiber officinale]|uniref:DEK-C domain-containing protein n=1 Tax=Zingiber officinale TaxID=94328 RepID=A0A8J5I426_ZINOF|nr:hypothetical protein ZIOFF_008958 [Zingiber officinale]